MRERINLGDTMEEVAWKMSEGNPGALSVIMRLLTKNLILLLDLDDMNIRGSAIWVGYKDHCKEDLDRFIECVRTRDLGMVETINTAIERGDCGEAVPMAVTHEKGKSDG